MPRGLVHIYVLERGDCREGLVNKFIDWKKEGGNIAFHTVFLFLKILFIMSVIYIFFLYFSIFLGGVWGMKLDDVGPLNNRPSSE